LSLNCLDSTWEDEKDSVLIGSRHFMNWVCSYFLWECLLTMELG